MIRRLLSTRRHVALDESDEYLLAWAAVRRAVESAGGRAWVFRGTGHEDRFLEFIEWSDAHEPPLSNEAVRAAFAQLDAYAAAAGSEEWEEAT